MSIVILYSTNHINGEPIFFLNIVSIEWVGVSKANPHITRLCCRRASTHHANLFHFNLFYCAVSSSDCIASNDLLINE
jgi:hypothetical protein